MKKISILGTTYRVYLGVPQSKDEGLLNNMGYCVYREKKIVVGDLSTYPNWKDTATEICQAEERATLRHEIIHAFLDESGLCGCSNGSDCWARNEEMVDWIANQWPKIQNVFAAFGCDAE